MACTHPYVLWTTGETRKKTNKKIYHFTRFDYEWLSWFLDHKKHSVYGDKFDFFLVPCGKCIDCKLSYRKDWSIRLLNELETSKNAYFLTLTYNDKHLGDKSLNKEDFQRFFKSLKEHYHGQGSSDIKYFCCGEYGGRTLRKHGHAIVYNLPDDDFTEFFPDEKGGYIRKCSKTGETLFYSPTIEKIWSKGFTDIGKVTFNSCSYVAGYVQKKLYGDDAKLYEENGLLPPFMICSKGLGQKYFVDHKPDIIKTNEVFYRKNERVCKSGSPRYYMKLLEKYDIDAFEQLKAKNRRFTNAYLKSLMSMSMFEQRSYFRNKKERGFDKDKALIRL